MRTVVTAIIKNPKQEKFLIVKKKSSAKVHGSKWLFPGGKVEKGEDVIEALKREIREETGLEIAEEIEQVSDYEYKTPNNEVAFGLCFACAAYSDEVHLSNELDNFAWITPKQFSRYNHVHGLEDEVERVKFKEVPAKQKSR